MLGGPRGHGCASFSPSDRVCWPLRRIKRPAGI